MEKEHVQDECALLLTQTLLTSFFLCNFFVFSFIFSLLSIRLSCYHWSPLSQPWVQLFGFLQSGSFWFCLPSNSCELLRLTTDRRTIKSGRDGKKILINEAIREEIVFLGQTTYGTVLSFISSTDNLECPSCQLKVSTPQALTNHTKSCNTKKRKADQAMVEPAVFNIESKEQILNWW